MPVDVMRETLRRFDRHRRQLLISELVDTPGRSFQLAFQRLPDRDELATATALVRRDGLPELCRALLNANEFLYY